MPARPLAIAALVLASGVARAAPCPVPGEAIHWVADWCMARLQTDDEIAASDCIEQEQQLKFKSACLSNLHYKTAMCEILVRAGTRSDTVNQCVQDKTFKGRTVQNGGVGG